MPRSPGQFGQWVLIVGTAWVLASALAWAGPGTADRGFFRLRLSQPWPQEAALTDIAGEPVRFPSSSPFSLVDAAATSGRSPPTLAMATLFLPRGASAAAPVPAVVMLHGASGVQHQREMTYARQLSAMGVAALVIDSFGPRRDMATGFVDRLLNITETMILADAYAALRYLKSRPDIDGSSVVLIVFSYGGMAAT